MTTVTITCCDPPTAGRGTTADLLLTLDNRIPNSVGQVWAYFGSDIDDGNSSNSPPLPNYVLTTAYQGKDQKKIQIKAAISIRSNAQIVDGRRIFLYDCNSNQLGSSVDKIFQVTK